MLQKGTLESVCQPGLCLYSRLFHDWGLEVHHRSVCPQRLHDVDEVQDGDGDVGLGVYPDGGLDVLDRPQGCLLPDSHPSGLSAISLVLPRESCLLVPCLVLWPVHSSAGVY